MRQLIKFDKYLVIKYKKNAGTNRKIQERSIRIQI